MKHSEEHYICFCYFDFAIQVFIKKLLLIRNNINQIDKSQESISNRSRYITNICLKSVSEVCTLVTFPMTIIFKEEHITAINYVKLPCYMLLKDNHWRNIMLSIAIKLYTWWWKHPQICVLFTDLYIYICMIIYTFALCLD